MSRCGGLRRLLRLVIVAALVLSLAVLWHEIDWAVVGGALAQVRWPAALAGLGCVLLAVWSKGMRWRLLLAGDVAVSPQLACGLVLVGQLANNGLPVRVGAGEAVRTALLRAGPAGSGYVLGTVLAEKLLDALGLLTVALLLGLLMPVPVWLKLAAPVLTLVGGLLVLIVLWLGLANGPRWLRAQSAYFWLGVQVSTRRGVLARALLWTAAGLGAGAAANWWSLEAVGAPPRLESALLVLLALYVGASLPSPPGRIGVFQALSVAALLPFGVGASVALAFGVVHYVAVVVVPSALGALFLLVVGDDWSRPPSQGDDPTRRRRQRRGRSV
ncbi:MAG: flippase-like domain-containing protein [Chloroflexi bacterium]|nr:flippase-like domain-containing protein [Chloroflexota bacterium]MBI4506355.1 flippase-like domain-containing protein [Chloroflexota bacterium]